MAGRLPFGLNKPLGAGLAGLAVILGVVGLRQTGLLQSLELWAYDRTVQLRPDRGPDPRLLIVTVSEADIQRQKQYPLSDQLLTKALGKLVQFEPAAVGLDIYRDLPVEPGHQAFKNLLAQSDRIIGVTKLGEGAAQGVPPPPGLAPDRVGASDIPVDAGGITRRALLYTTPKGSPVFSLPMVLALYYLEDQGITLDRNPTNPDQLRLGKAVLPPLDANAGSYLGNDARGYQTLINYQSATQVARRISLTDVLADKLTAADVKGKVVLFGITAESVKDLFYTPYSAGLSDDQKMPGVFIQAQVVSQLLSAAEGQAVWPWYWTDNLENLWIVVWGLVGGVLAVVIRPRWALALAGSVGVGLVLGVGWYTFNQNGWIPVIPPLLTLVAGLAAVRVSWGLVSPGLGQDGTISAPGLDSTATVVGGTVVGAVPANPMQNRSLDLGTRYALEKTLGAGGMGEVYLARDTVVGRQVAVKVLKANIANQPELRLRFEREVAICAALESSNIVQVTDYGVTPQGYPFYVMEYLRGQTLGDLLKKEGRVEVARATGIIQQVCVGLSLAHRGVVLAGETTPRTLVHRDLKPDNIFLVPTVLGELVKILDFGIVKVESDRMTMTGQFIGTSRYAAPEQWQGEQSLDQRADIYSLGVIFYEMLSGADPFGLGKGATTLAQWYTGHVLSAPKPLMGQPDMEHIPAPLAETIMRCLAKNPEDRFANVDQLKAALENL